MRGRRERVLLTDGFIRLGSYEVFSELIPEDFKPLLPQPNRSYYLYAEGISLYLFINYSVGVADEVQGYEVAKQLIESMKAKEPLETLKEVLESSSKTQTNLTEERKMLMIIITRKNVEH